MAAPSRVARTGLLDLCVWWVRYEMIQAQWTTAPRELYGTVILANEKQSVVSTRSGKWMVYGPDAMAFAVGDVIQFEGERQIVDRFEIEGGFDYVRYLQGQGFAGVFSARTASYQGRRFVGSTLRFELFDVSRSYVFAGIGGDDYRMCCLVPTIRSIPIGSHRSDRLASRICSQSRECT
ncbi:MAG: DUF4131 domain-containing protein [Bacillus subtilis]|nr:DUF4131 domain-containing protein [Bacillus subtilis]